MPHLLHDGRSYAAKIQGKATVPLLLSPVMLKNNPTHQFELFIYHEPGQTPTRGKGTQSTLNPCMPRSHDNKPASTNCSRSQPYHECSPHEQSIRYLSYGARHSSSEVKVGDTGARGEVNEGVGDGGGACTFHRGLKGVYSGAV